MGLLQTDTRQAESPISAGIVKGLLGLDQATILVAAMIDKAEVGFMASLREDAQLPCGFTQHGIKRSAEAGLMEKPCEVVPEGHFVRRQRSVNRP